MCLTASLMHRMPKLAICTGLTLCFDLQDVVQFVPLTMTLLGQLTTDPLVIPQIFRHVGILPVLGWVRHFLALAVYTIVSKVRGLAKYAPPKATNRDEYLRNRRVESLKYGCGYDYAQ